MIFGEISALMAAAFYATSATIFSTLVKETTLFLFNLSRGSISLIFTFLSLIVSSNSIFPDTQFENIILLSISGILAIAIGDSFYFKSLGLLGTRKTLLFGTMAPSFTGLISYFYYGSTISIGGWIGVFLTISGIFIVVNERTKETPQQALQDCANEKEVDSTIIQLLKEQPEINQFNESEKTPNSHINKDFSGYTKNFQGILSGIGFSFCQACGMILSHDACKSKTISSLQSAFIRVISGCIALTLIISISKNEKFKWSWHTTEKNVIFALGTILGPFLGIWCQQAALIHTRPEIAQTLQATAPLFGLLISYYRGEQMKIKYLIGSLISILGVGIIIWS